MHSIENALALWNEQMERMQFTWTVARTEHAGQLTAMVSTRCNSAPRFTVINSGNRVLAVTLIDNTGSQTTETDVLFNTANPFQLLPRHGLYDCVTARLFDHSPHRVARTRACPRARSSRRTRANGRRDHERAHQRPCFTLSSPTTLPVWSRSMARHPNPPAPTGNCQLLQTLHSRQCGHGRQGHDRRLHHYGDYDQEGHHPRDWSIVGRDRCFRRAPESGARVARRHRRAYFRSNDDWRTDQEQEIIATRSGHRPMTSNRPSWPISLLAVTPPLFPESGAGPALH